MIPTVSPSSPSTGQLEANMHLWAPNKLTVSNTSAFARSCRLFRADLAVAVALLLVAMPPWPLARPFPCCCCCCHRHHPGTAYDSMLSFTQTWGSFASLRMPLRHSKSSAASTSTASSTSTESSTSTASPPLTGRGRRFLGWPRWSTHTGTLGSVARRSAHAHSCRGLACKSKEKLLPLPAPALACFCSARRPRAKHSSELKSLSTRGQVARLTMAVSPSFKSPA
mmetsp:Transcript_71092/g.143083  ORF Transcript_71092/g.143083 Transcript_71092/m.143083 type:complete len:225 (-) Transcript_71092:658-1332(-)